MRPDVRSARAGGLIVSYDRANLMILKTRGKEVRGAVAGCVRQQDHLAWIAPADRVDARRVR